MSYLFQRDKLLGVEGKPAKLWPWGHTQGMTPHEMRRLAEPRWGCSWAWEGSGLGTRGAGSQQSPGARGVAFFSFRSALLWLSSSVLFFKEAELSDCFEKGGY